MAKKSKLNLTDLAKKITNPTLTPKQINKYGIQLAKALLQKQRQSILYKPRKQLLSKYRYYQKQVTKYNEQALKMTSSYNYKNDFEWYVKTKGRTLKNNNQLKKHIEHIKTTIKEYGLKPSMSSGEIYFNIKTALKFGSKNSYLKYKEETNWLSGEKNDFMTSAYDAIKYQNVRDINVFKKSIRGLTVSQAEKSNMLKEIEQIIANFSKSGGI